MGGLAMRLPVFVAVPATGTMRRHPRARRVGSRGAMHHLTGSPNVPCDPADPPCPTPVDSPQQPSSRHPPHDRRPAAPLPGSRSLDGALTCCDAGSSGRCVAGRSSTRVCGRPGHDTGGRWPRAGTRHRTSGARRHVGSHHAVHVRGIRVAGGARSRGPPDLGNAARFSAVERVRPGARFRLRDWRAWPVDDVAQDLRYRSASHAKPGPRPGRADTPHGLGCAVASGVAHGARRRKRVRAAWPVRARQRRAAAVDAVDGASGRIPDIRRRRIGAGPWWRLPAHRRLARHAVAAAWHRPHRGAGSPLRAAATAPTGAARRRDGERIPRRSDAGGDHRRR